MLNISKIRKINHSSYYIGKNTKKSSYVVKHKYSSAGKVFFICSEIVIMFLCSRAHYHKKSTVRAGVYGF